MTIPDTKKIIAVITAAYPAHYKGFNQSMIENLVAVWHEAFKEGDYEAVSTGLKRFIKVDDSGFPPVPGQIRKKMPSKYEYMLEEIMRLEEHNLKRLSG